MARCEELDVSHNNLSALPKHINGLKSLRELNCSHNALSDLPLFIGTIKPLKVTLIAVYKIVLLLYSCMWISVLDQ